MTANNSRKLELALRANAGAAKRVELLEGLNRLGVRKTDVDFLGLEATDQFLGQISDLMRATAGRGDSEPLSWTDAATAQAILGHVGASFSEHLVLLFSHAETTGAVQMPAAVFWSKCTDLARLDRNGVSGVVPGVSGGFILDFDLADRAETFTLYTVGDLGRSISLVIKEAGKK